jgi:formylglycine-generating enzyme required for sulfatase activity
VTSEECTPEPIASEWSVCGFANACDVDGSQTRLLYTGACDEGRCEVTSVEESRTCGEQRVTEGDPCALDGAAGECVSGRCLAFPARVVNVAASDGTSTSFVRVTWSAVDGATGYNVYRDGELLTSSPIAALQFDHTTAPAGGLPQQVTGAGATPATDRITVTWTAASLTSSAGTAAAYVVAAVNPAGEGPRSASDSGNRAGFPLTGYEVRIDAGSSWVPVGTSTNYSDTDAPAGAITLSELAASDGTSVDHVTLSATVGTTPGATRTYEVRAVNAAGPGPGSTVVSRQRLVGVPSLQRQRSSGPTASGFSNIAGATTTPFNDTGAPADGGVRHYRLQVTAAGATDVTSPSEFGFRRVERPLDGLGDACTLDNECPDGSWCSTVTAQRRCSPRLFEGQDHQMDFVYVPAGTFEQGTPGATDGERPYLATLTRSYFVSRTEVTQGQWRAATGGINPSCFQSPTGSSCTFENANDGGPVEQVDWYAALAYANWLSTQNGLQPCYVLSGCADESSGWHDGAHLSCSTADFIGLDCTGYRLLTESEWERAARAGTTTDYYWGNETADATVSLYGWFSANAGGRPQPVALRLPNPFGLFDVSGNVSEWAWDNPREGAEYIPYPVGSATDYLGPSSGTNRSKRGGSATFFVSASRSARRDYDPASFRRANVGFRLCRTVP